MLFRFGVQFAIPDVPVDVTLHLARQEYLVDTLINKVEEDPEDVDRILKRKVSDVELKKVFFDLASIPETLPDGYPDYLDHIKIEESSEHEKQSLIQTSPKRVQNAEHSLRSPLRYREISRSKSN